LKSLQYKILHPFLFAAYPVLALLAHNIEEIKIIMTLRALVLSLMLIAALYLILNLFIKNQYEAGLITSLIAVLFFSYGHVYNYLKLQEPFGIPLGRHRFLLLILIGLLAAGLWLILRHKGSLLSVTRMLNIIAAIALLFPMAQIGIFGIQSVAAKLQNPQHDRIAADLRLPAKTRPPDIYYIVLDAYARDDTLLEDFGLDIRPFLESLEDLGFYIAHCSKSNYAQTRLSLVTSLNMDYIDKLGDQYKPGNSSRVGLSEKIHHSAIRYALEQLGYKTIAFETGFKTTQLEDADIYLSYQTSTLGKAQVLGGVNSFEKMLLDTSAGRLLTDGALLHPQFFQPDFENHRKIHRQRVLYTFEQLRNLPNTPDPKFVFVHLVIPHGPYVFGPDGEFVDFDKPVNPGYQDQIKYINKVLVPLLEEIINQSPTEPIIILQGDHGAINAYPNDRMNILNAYYLPIGGSYQLYENITPVNTFRVILNHYFGGDLELLEDTSYFSVYNRPYELTPIPELRPGCP